MTRRGFEYYDWNAYDHDAEGGNYSVEQMVQFAVHEVNISSRNDTIMLLHDTYGKEKTVQALPSIIRQLKDAGIQLLPIDIPPAGILNAKKIRKSCINIKKTMVIWKKVCYNKV